MPELGTCEVWHDRAVFHFLTEHDDRASYATLAKRTVQLGGHMIVSTFAKDGPPRCSGLDVRRYAADELAACFPGFRLVSGANEVHVTPFQSRQSFVYAVLKRE